MIRQITVQVGSQMVRIELTDEAADRPVVLRRSISGSEWHPTDDWRQELVSEDRTLY